MVGRKELKRAYALVDLNRHDEATTLLHEVANQGFGQDAEEATAALAQLGV